MTGGSSTIVEFWRDEEETATRDAPREDDILLLKQAVLDIDDPDETPPPAPSRTLPILFALAGLSWLAFAGWATARAGQWQAGVGAWPGLVATLLLPLVLLGVLYLLAFRNSRTEARRYLDTARALRTEADLLELRLGRIADSLEAARQTMQDQAALLESYGAAASSNMEASADVMATHARTTAERAETAERAGAALIARMDALVSALPEFEERAAKMANSIEDNGHSLAARIDTLEARLHSLTELSDDARSRTLSATKSLASQLSTLQEATRATVEEVNGMSDLAAARIGATLKETRTAMEAGRQGLEDQAQALDDLVSQAQTQIGATSRTAVTAFATDMDQVQGGLKARLEATLEESRIALDLGRRGVEEQAAALDALVARARAAVVATSHDAAIAFSTDMDAVQDGLRQRLETALHDSRAALEAGRQGLEAQARALDTLVTQAQAHIAQTSQSAVGGFADDMDRVQDGLRARLDTTLETARDTLAMTDDALTRQAGALDALIARARDSLATLSGETVSGFADDIGEVESRVHQLNDLVEGQRTLITGLGATLDQAIDTSEARFAALESGALARTDRLTAALAAMTAETARIDAALASGGLTTEKLIGQAEGLLLALDSGVRELDETYPVALDRFDARMGASRALIDAATPEMERLEAIAEAIAGRTQESEELLRGQGARLTEWLESTQGGLEANRLLVQRLRDALDGAHQDATRITEGAGPLLVTALLRVKDTADQAAERARQALGRAIPEAAKSLADASEQALREAVGDRVQAQIERLATVAEEAVKTAHQASDRLMRQLLTIADTSAQVQDRIEQADRAAEEKSRDHFSHRSALLIESLNSTAIDVAKILSNDVTDSAWSSYLKGDRGVFTRRAVKLLDAGESREIALHYDADPEFREHVNRYIHDFEAMLRIILSARDGNALAVAVLSSDMGKLYVALAQAIERLRQ